MTREQAEVCVMAGVNIALEAAEGGADIIGTGDMGIGNTTASSAIGPVERHIRSPDSQTAK